MVWSGNSDKKNFLCLSSFFSGFQKSSCKCFVIIFFISKLAPKTAAQQANAEAVNFIQIMKKKFSMIIRYFVYKGKGRFSFQRAKTSATELNVPTFTSDSLVRAQSVGKPAQTEEFRSSQIAALGQVGASGGGSSGSRVGMWWGRRKNKESWDGHKHPASHRAACHSVHFQQSCLSVDLRVSFHWRASFISLIFRY